MLIILSLALLSINSIYATTGNQNGNIANTSEIQQNNTNITNSNNTTIPNSSKTTNSSNIKNNNSTKQPNEAAGGSSYSKVKAIWIPSAYVANLNVTALQKLGITDVFVKANLISTPTTPTYSSILPLILQKLKGTNIRVHAWITCFKDADSNWINPTNKTQQTFLINKITDIVKNYDIDGINLDYVRYSGSGSNVADTIGTATITAFVQLVYNTVKSVNSSIAVSADLMPEKSTNAYSYGQDYAQLAKCLDFMVPMIYKGNYGYNSSTGTNSKNQSGTSWIGLTVAYIVSQANGTPVVAGLQTYRSDSNVTAIPASELQNDVDAAINNGSSGYALFRYGLINSSFSVDSTAPTVKTIDPANKATNVSVSKLIKVTLSESIKKGNYWIELKDSKGKAVPFTTSINGNVLTITPTNGLVNATTYELILHTGCLTDLAGNKLALYTSTFTTDRTAPTVKSIDPANKSMNVSVNKVIKVTLSESIKKGNYWIELNGGGKTVPVTTSISGNVLTITPTSSLTKGTKYTLILHTGSVTDLAGNKLALYTSTFTTNSTAPPVDSTAPTIKTIDPANKSVNVSVNKVIKVTFSESIKAGTNYIELKDSNGKAVPFTKSISNNVLTITPTNNLSSGTKYTLTLYTGSLTDLSGNKLTLYTSTFTTDGTAPAVKSVDPANKSVNVSVSKVIKVTFSESIKKGNGWIELNGGGKTVPFTTSISGNVLTITPTTKLSTGTKYTLILHTGSVTDLSSNNVSLYTSTFTTNGTIFTSVQIQNAAAIVKSYIETNNRLPNYVTIGSSQITMPQFLQLLVTSLLQINSGTNTAMTPGSIKAPTSPTGSYIYGNVYKTEYLNIAQSIKSYINSNGIVPNYASSSLGNIQYESLVYSYSKILNYYKTNGALPNYVLVDSSVTNTAVPSELQQYLQATTNCQVTNSQIIAKAAYITSDKTSAYDKAAAIFNWVRDNIGYTFYNNTYYGAVGTLNAKTGNCVDTSHLLIALERAAGIPARYEHVYAQFSSGKWYGHVIAQVWVNGKWYNADATSYSNTFGVIKNWDTSSATYKGTYATLPF